MSSERKQASTKIYRAIFKFFVNKAINFNVESIRETLCFMVLLGAGRGLIEAVRFIANAKARCETINWD